VFYILFTISAPTILLSTPRPRDSITIPLSLSQCRHLPPAPPPKHGPPNVPPPGTPLQTECVLGVNLPTPMAVTPIHPLRVDPLTKARALSLPNPNRQNLQNLRNLQRPPMATTFIAVPSSNTSHRLQTTATSNRHRPDPKGPTHPMPPMPPIRPMAPIHPKHPMAPMALNQRVRHRAGTPLS